LAMRWLEEFYGDTLLQQTSMMVKPSTCKHHRPGWWPSSRLGSAYSCYV
jgi:hypothetical protein